MKTRNKVILWAAGITATGALTGGILASQGTDEKNEDTVKGDGDCHVVEAGGDVTCGGEADKPDTFQGEEAAAHKGPWRYKVVNTFIDGRDEGLRVRACNVDDCAGPDSAERIGIVLQNHTVWVVCKEDSGFNGGEPDGGTTWYKVKWPTNKPTPGIELESSREDPYSGWMFGKYMSPSGHDGKIAECKDLG